MATGITIDDLIKTMEKAGIPLNTMTPNNTFKNQSDRMAASRGQVAGAFAGQAPTPPHVEKYKKDYMAKIAKIAEMDQKLAGVYSNPSSNLYIEHAGQRDNAIYGARPAMEGDAQTPINEYNQDVGVYNNQLGEFDQKVKEAESYYDSLIAEQKLAEKQKGVGTGTADLDFDELVASIAEGDTNEGGFSFDDFIAGLE